MIIKLLKKEADELEKKKDEFSNLKNLYEKNKNIVFNFTNNLQIQENLIDNFKLFINEFASDINDLNVKNNISVIGIDYNDKINQINNKKCFDEINILSQKINNFASMIENIKNNKLKKIERKYVLIQKDLNEIELSIKNNDPNLKLLLTINNGLIQKNLDELNILVEDLQKEENIYLKVRTEIENDIEELQKKGKELTEEVEKIKQSFKEKERIKKNYPKIDKLFLKNSMLLGINEFHNPNEIFSSRMLFNDKNINSENAGLLERNWKEICYVYDDYDLHEVNYELKAVGLEKNEYFSKSSIGFFLERLIEVIEFKIDGKKSDYNYENSLLSFDINLENLQSNQIYIKYKESPQNLTEAKKRRGNFTDLIIMEYQKI